METRLINTDLTFAGVSRIKNLPEAVDDSEPVTLSQLKALEERQSVIDYEEAVNGSIPVYSQLNGKFIANELNTKLTLTDGGNF
jgi:hypothetical protein